MRKVRCSCFGDWEIQVRMALPQQGVPLEGVKVQEIIKGNCTDFWFCAGKPHPSGMRRASKQEKVAESKQGENIFHVVVTSGQGQGRVRSPYAAGRGSGHA